MKLKAVIPEAVTLLFILLWMYAASNKLMDFEGFKLNSVQSPILNPISKLVSVFIPAIEIIISLLLLSKKSSIDRSVCVIYPYYDVHHLHSIDNTVQLPYPLFLWRNSWMICPGMSIWPLIYSLPL